jgi:hypothetical protein
MKEGDMSGSSTQRFVDLSPTGYCLAALLLVFNMSCAEASPPETSPDVILDRPSSSEIVPAEIIVKLKETPGAPTTVPAQDLAPLGLDTTPVQRTSGGELVYRLTDEASSRSKTAEEKRARLLEIVEQLEARPDVDYAQPNWLVQPFSP